MVDTIGQRFTLCYGAWKDLWSTGCGVNSSDCIATDDGRVTGWVVLLSGSPTCSYCGKLAFDLRLDNRSRMSREIHVRFSEGLGVRVPWATRLVALCRTRQEAEATLAKIQAWVERHGLQLHPDKTQLGNCMEKGQGFEFLGYRFEAGRRWVRPKSRKALRDKIREKTGRTRSGSLETIIKELNPILRGWFVYFKQAHRTTFPDVDGFVRRRLRAILRKREKQLGFGRITRDHRRWPNAFFAEQGLFTLQEAYILASQSR